MQRSKVILGDLHQKLNSKEYLDILFDQVIPVCGNFPEKMDLVILGDIYDGKAIIRSEIQNCFSDFLLRISDYFEKIYLLVGNHDLENLQKKETSLNVFKRFHDKVVVIDRPVAVEEILMCPYIHDQNEFKQTIDSYCSSGMIKYLFLHQGFNGFEYREGIVCDDAVEINILPPEAKIVFSGHFHKPQQLGNFIYVGSCWSQSFGEANQQKRFFVLTKDGGIEEHNISGLPRHLIFNLEVESQEEFQSELTNISKDIKEEDIVKLSITAPKETVDKVGSVILPGGLEGRVSLQVQFFLKEDKPEILIDDSLNPIDMLYQYIDLNKEQFKNIDTKKIKLLGKKYLQSCEGVEGA